MKKLLGLMTVAACLGLALFLRAQTLGPTTPTSTAQSTLSPDQVARLLQSSLAIMNAMPAPVDDPLLDANGNVVLDASGNPVSDPNEQFHSVKPQEFDPAHTYLVQAAWLNGIGCPTNATVATYPSTTPTGTFPDPGCPTADPKDQHNEGLLLVKTGPSSNNASATAELKKVKGTVLTELGWDIRKSPTLGLTASPQGSHCGGGAPRWNISTDMGFFFIGCDSGTIELASNAWIRMRWGVGKLAAAGIPADAKVQRIQIVFDEGTDTGLDFFGAAVLDNIDVNGTLVGHGPTDGN
jgi:hypothetical protein